MRCGIIELVTRSQTPSNDAAGSLNSFLVRTPHIIAQMCYGGLLYYCSHVTTVNDISYMQCHRARMRDLRSFHDGAGSLNSSKVPTYQSNAKKYGVDFLL
jgi:hypothetical protein